MCACIYTYMYKHILYRKRNSEILRQIRNYSIYSMKFKMKRGNYRGSNIFF